MIASGRGRGREREAGQHLAFPEAGDGDRRQHVAGQEHRDGERSPGAR